MKKLDTPRKNDRHELWMTPYKGIAKGRCTRTPYKEIVQGSRRKRLNKGTTKPSQSAQRTIQVQCKGRTPQRRESTAQMH